MISNGKMVTIHYQLSVDGEVIDSSKERGPLEYRQGSGQIIRGLERTLEGLKPGDTAEAHIGPEDAYGPINPQAVIEIPKDKIEDENIEIGTVLNAQAPDGSALQGRVEEIRGENYLVNFNHPLAGKELFFEIEVLKVED